LLFEETQDFDQAALDYLADQLLGESGATSQLEEEYSQEMLDAIDEFEQQAQANSTTAMKMSSQ